MQQVSPEALAELVAARDGAREDYVTVRGEASLWDVIAKMRANGASVALVTSKDGQFAAADVQGVIARKDILDTLADDMELFSG
jgi:CBS domain-containing protein